MKLCEIRMTCDLVLIQGGRRKFGILIAALSGPWWVNLQSFWIPVYLKHENSLRLPATKVAKPRHRASGDQWLCLHCILPADTSSLHPPFKMEKKKKKDPVTVLAWLWATCGDPVGLGSVSCLYGALSAYGVQSTGKATSCLSAATSVTKKQ